jgi:hypothetical protein
VDFELKKNGPNQLTPPKDTPEWIKFAKHLLGGFALLMWFGAALCFTAFAVQHAYLSDAPKDYVRYLLHAYICKIDIIFTIIFNFLYI